MRAVSTSFLVVVSLAMGFAAQAQQSFPSKPIRWFVGYPAGSGLDFITRAVTEPMSRSLGQPIVVENRTGASGAIAATAVTSSAPDGYTVLSTDLGTYALNPHLFSKLPYDSKRDLKVVGMLVNIPFVMFVPASMPARNVPEFVAWVKSQPPGKVNFASSGLGTVHQMNMEILARKAGLQMTHVPYKGSTAAFPDVISGQVSAFFVGPNDGMPFVKAGKLRILATATPKRLELLPDVPTLAESGYDTGYSAWLGVSVPAGTPAPVVERLNQAVNEAMRLPEVSRRFTELGFIVFDRESSRQVDDFAKAQYDEWGTIVRSFNIRLD
jgi:tripartite-type tricarboxylate transporter receptor subunit TctC